MRMNAAETSASSAIADCTPLTVASRSSTTAEIDTFISDVSTTSTNIAIASRIGSRLLRVSSGWLYGADIAVTSSTHAADGPNGSVRAIGRVGARGQAPFAISLSALASYLL